MSILIMFGFVYIVIPVITLVIKIIDRQVKIRQYKKSTYYQVTHNEYRYTMSDKGRRGEYLLYRNLAPLEAEGAKFLFNVYLPREDKSTTEIDMIMFYRGEVFVFENKNYGGWIFGKATDLYWTQSYRSRRRAHKEKFYNPIMQNEMHVKYLRQIIGNQARINSVIVFSDRATFKKIENYNTASMITQTRFVLSYVKTKMYMTCMEDTEKYYQMLYPYSQVSDEVKAKHIENINVSKNVQHSQGLQNPKITIGKSNFDTGIYSSGAVLFSEAVPAQSVEKKESDGKNKKKTKLIQTIAMICGILFIIFISIVLMRVYENQKVRQKNDLEEYIAANSKEKEVKESEEAELDPFAYIYKGYLTRLIEIENRAREFVATCEANDYQLSEEECDAFYQEFSAYLEEIDSMLTEFDEYNDGANAWNINEKSVITSYQISIVAAVKSTIDFIELEDYSLVESKCNNIIYATGTIHNQIEYIAYWGIHYQIDEVDGKVVIISDID